MLKIAYQLGVKLALAEVGMAPPNSKGIQAFTDSVKSMKEPEAQADLTVDLADQSPDDVTTKVTWGSKMDLSAPVEY